MLSEKDFKEMCKVAHKDIENKAFVFGEIDKNHVPKVAACGNYLNTMVIIASLINQTIENTGVSRIDYIHDLNQMLKEARGENE